MNNDSNQSHKIIKIISLEDDSHDFSIEFNEHSNTYVVELKRNCTKENTTKQIIIKTEISGKRVLISKQGTPSQYKSLVIANEKIEATDRNNNKEIGLSNGEFFLTTADDDETKEDIDVNIQIWNEDSNRFFAEVHAKVAIHTGRRSVQTMYINHTFSWQFKK